MLDIDLELFGQLFDVIQILFLVQREVKLLLDALYIRSEFIGLDEG